MATSFVFILNCRRHGHAFNLPGYCIREIHGCPEKSASKCRQTCSLFDKGNGIYRWGRQRTPKRLSPSRGRKRDALPHGTHKSLPCAKGGGSAFGAPAKPSVSGFAGERRSSGATALFALKAETKDAELVTTKAPWRVFLHYLSSREERWCPRRALDNQCGKIIRNNASGKPSVSGEQ